MKAIAEFEMPRSCYFCPFTSVWTKWCWLLRREIIVAHMYREKDCPLKEKKEEDKDDD